MCIDRIVLHNGDFIEYTGCAPLQPYRLLQFGLVPGLGPGPSHHVNIQHCAYQAHNALMMSLISLGACGGCGLCAMLSIVIFKLIKNYTNKRGNIN